MTVETAKLWQFIPDSVAPDLLHHGRCFQYLWPNICVGNTTIK